MNSSNMAEYETKLQDKVGKITQRSNFHSKQLKEFADNREKEQSLLQLQKGMRKPLTQPRNLQTIQCGCSCCPDENELFEKAIEARANLIKRLNEIVNKMEKGEKAIEKNTANWIKSNTDGLQVCAVARTHDSEKRAAANGEPGKAAFFPNMENAPSHYATDSSFTDYDKKHLQNKSSIMIKPQEFNAWQHGNILILVAQEMKSDEKIRRTLIHELQHYADKNAGTEYQEEIAGANTRKRDRIDSHTEDSFFFGKTNIHNVIKFPAKGKVQVNSYVIIDDKHYDIQFSRKGIEAIGNKIDVTCSWWKKSVIVVVRYVTKNNHGIISVCTKELTVNADKRISSASTPFYSASLDDNITVTINELPALTKTSQVKKGDRFPLIDKKADFRNIPDRRISEKDVLNAYRVFKTEFAAHYLSEKAVPEENENQPDHTENVYSIVNKIIEYPDVKLMWQINPQFKGRTFKDEIKKYADQIIAELKDNVKPSFSFNDLNSIRINALYLLVDKMQNNSGKEGEEVDQGKIQQTIAALDATEKTFVLNSDCWNNKINKLGDERKSMFNQILRPQSEEEVSDRTEPLIELIEMSPIPNPLCQLNALYKS